MNIIATEVANSTPPSATRRKRGLLWAMPVWCIQIRVHTAAGILPSHRRRSTCQSTLPLCWWIEPPTILVTAANHKSVPTADAGATPNSSTRMGVINEPPPTPVRPTMMPTPKPAKVLSQFIHRSLH